MNSTDNIQEHKDLLFSNKSLYKLFVPLLIEQFLMLTVSLADSIMVSSLGESAVSGVSLVDFIMMLVIFVFVALATGGAVIAGQYLGAQKITDAKKTAEQIMWFMGVAGLVVMALVILGKPFILEHLFGHITPEVKSNANVYLSIVSLSIPFIALFNGGAAIYRTSGNSKTPMQVVLIMNIVNIIGNATLIYGLGWGVEGVALPTFVSRLLSAVLMIICLLRKEFVLHLENSWKPIWKKSLLKRILSIGIPYAVENGLFQLGRVVIVVIVSTFGTRAIAANAVAGILAVFEVLPGIAISAGMTTVIARCVGAEDEQQVRYYNKKIIKLVYLAHLAMNVLIIMALPLIMKLYNLTPETTALAEKIAMLHGLFAVTIWPISFCLPVTFRASGDAKFPMYVGISTMIICRIALAYFLGVYLQMGVIGTWLAMFIDWIARAIIFTLRYFKGTWLKYRAV